jgi:hypothetical protein
MLRPYKIWRLPFSPVPARFSLVGIIGLHLDVKNYEDYILFSEICV